MVGVENKSGLAGVVRKTEVLDWVGVGVGIGTGQPGIVILSLGLLIAKKEAEKKLEA